MAKAGVGKPKEKASDDAAPVVEPQEEQEQVVLEEEAVNRLPSCRKMLVSRSMI